VPDLGAVAPKEVDEYGSGRVREPEHRSMVDVVLGRIARDPAEDR
jgi:hypothetical protein